MTQVTEPRGYLTWEELTHGPTNQEKQLLIQAIAILSTQPAYEKMTLPEVYGRIVSALRIAPVVEFVYQLEGKGRAAWD